MEERFTCADCKCEIIHTSADGGGTGYAIRATDKAKICYTCVGKADEKTLRETGKLWGYLTGRRVSLVSSHVSDLYHGPRGWRKPRGVYTLENGAFTNWPGSFSVNVSRVKLSYNNWGAPRQDFWFTWEGNKYHGVQVGESSECARVSRIKG